MQQCPNIQQCPNMQQCPNSRQSSNPIPLSSTPLWTLMGPSALKEGSEPQVTTVHGNLSPSGSPFGTSRPGFCAEFRCESSRGVPTTSISTCCLPMLDQMFANFHKIFTTSTNSRNFHQIFAISNQIFAISTTYLQFPRKYSQFPPNTCNFLPHIRNFPPTIR